MVGLVNWEEATEGRAISTGRCARTVHFFWTQYSHSGENVSSEGRESETGVPTIVLEHGRGKGQGRQTRRGTGITRDRN